MDDEAIPFEDRAAFEAWLDEHHAASDGIWIKFAKKGSGIRSVTYKEVLPVALAHGWIDGQGRRLDDEWWLQKLVPRGRRSLWSRINRDAALALIARLPRDQAEAVLLRVVVGLDAKAAAKVLGKRAGAVRTAAHRGLRALAEHHPATQSQRFGADGQLNRYVNVYLNDEDVRVLDGLDTSVGEADTLVILPAMAGGSA